MTEEKTGSLSNEELLEMNAELIKSQGLIIEGTRVTGFTFLYSYKHTELIIPEGVTEVMAGVLCRFKDIHLPSTLERIIYDSPFSRLEEDVRLHITNIYKWSRVEIPKELRLDRKVVYFGDEPINELELPQEKVITKELLDGFRAKGGITRLIIPNGVEEIASDAFYAFDNLKEMHIPPTLKRMGPNGTRDGMKVYISDLDAFCRIEFEDSIFVATPLAADDSALYLNGEEITTLNLTDGMEVKSGVFDMYKRLKHIKITGKVKIDRNAFNGCEIESVSVDSPENMLALGFERDEKAKVYIDGNEPECINFPDGTDKIPPCIFKNVQTIKEALVPKGTLEIGEYAFGYCTSLERVILPEGLLKIGAYAFYKCSGIKEIVLPSTLVEIDSYAFAYSGLERIVIPKSVKKLDGWCFRSCTSLKEIKLLGCPDMIGECAFGMLDNGAEITVTGDKKHAKEWHNEWMYDTYKVKDAGKAGLKKVHAKNHKIKFVKE